MYFYVTLSGAVWVIYTTDHIFDGYRSRGNCLNPVYRFHYANRKYLIAIIVIVIIICAYLAGSYLEKNLLTFGVLLSLMVFIYLVLNMLTEGKKKYFPKEFLIAILYTLGVFGGFYVLTGSINSIQVLVLLNFFFITFANVLFFSVLDYEQDKLFGFNTIVRSIGKRFARHIMILLLVLAFFCTQVLGFYYSQWKYYLIFVLMNLMLAIIIAIPVEKRDKLQIGFIADAVFFLPAILYFL